MLLRPLLPRLPAPRHMALTTALLATRAVVAGSAPPSAARLQVTTFNIAAVNNNPFEYWITSPDAQYNKLMDGVEFYMNAPHVREFSVGEVFEWYGDLEKMIKNAGLATQEQLGALRTKWDTDLSKRKIVSGFLKDPEIGTKRLVSMPDRVTNTINTESGAVLYRPTPISCYQGRFKNISDWWRQWREFMFAPNSLLPKGKAVVGLLKPIPRSKYPELTEEEERISLPLQILCQGIFDSILVHMLNKVSRDQFEAQDVWQDLRASTCKALNLQKNDRLFDILNKAYMPTTDVLCLQEVSGAFALRAQTMWSADFAVYTPSSAAAASREQNSVIALRKSRFVPEQAKDVTSMVLDRLKAASPGGKLPIDDGDLLVLLTVLSQTQDGGKILIASFHGDTDGLATIPVLHAVNEYAKSVAVDRLVFGLDANAYEKPKKGKQLDVREFAKVFRGLGMTSCWGPEPNPSFYTTFNARTYLQPQLNKASGRTEVREKGDVNPKDFILGYQATTLITDGLKDNTGVFKYVEDQVFPSFQFPSDHGIVSANVEFLEKGQKAEL